MGRSTRDRAPHGRCGSSRSRAGWPPTGSVRKQERSVAPTLGTKSMNATNKVWLPAGLDEGYRQALAVPPPQGQMSRSLYESLLADRLQALIDASPREATQAM